MLRKIFSTCLGLLCLPVITQLGATTATAADRMIGAGTADQIVDFKHYGDGFMAMTVTGDCYISTGNRTDNFYRGANVFTSSGFQELGDQLAGFTIMPCSGDGFPSWLAVSLRGHFYDTTDRGASWTHRTTVYDLPGHPVRAPFMEPAPEGEEIVGISRYTDDCYAVAVITASGNVYSSDVSGWEAPAGNIYSGGPTSIRWQTLGELKVRYR